MTTHKKLKTPAFQIGYEIEAFWPCKLANGCDITDAIDMKDALKEYLYQTKSYSKAEIQVVGRIKWVEDSTLSNRRHQIFGKEMILPVLPASQAEKLLLGVLVWMQKIDAQTNQQCGLHINISPVDRKLANKVDYLQLLGNVRQEKILSSYNRTSNAYCAPTERVARDHWKAYLQTKSKAERQAESISQDLRLRPQLRRAIFRARWQSITTGMREEALVRPQLPLVERQAGLVNNLRTLRALERRIVGAVNENRKGHSIVEKESRLGRYFEFRMTGNTDYHKRGHDIVRLGRHYQDAITKSLTPRVSDTLKDAKIFLDKTIAVARRPAGARQRS